MKNFLYLILVSVSSLGYGQIKKVQFDPNFKVDASKIDLKFDPTISETKILDLSYKNVLHAGIKPGYTNERGVPTHFDGKLSHQFAPKGKSKSSQAQAYIKLVSPLMKVDDMRISFDLASSETDELGIDHYRFTQKYNGVPIYGAEIILHGKNGEFDFLNGNYHPIFELASVVPSLSADQAMAACVTDRGTAMKYQHFLGPLADQMKETKTLVIYKHYDAYKLAYHITSYKNLAERWEYFVDATDGSIIKKYESLCKFHHHNNGDVCHDNREVTIVNPPNDGKATATALDLFDINRTINTYQVGTKFYMIDGSRDIFTSAPSTLPDDPTGVIWTIDAFNTSPQNDNFKYDHITSSGNTWNNKTGVSAHYNGGKAFEYFRTVHNRKSINGAGGNIVSIINVADDDGSKMDNAFWNGAAMFYGNGKDAFKPLARGLDVAGHEMTHGVVQSTANLEYEGESGALNESFADIFGAMIDRDDWRVGEDVVLPSAFPSGALRSLEDPHNGAATNNFNAGWQPRTYSERYKGTEDNGGVHINSGVANWAFFKFATAVGKEKAEKVYYQALSKYLTKSSQFVDCRIAVVKSATDLYGATEIAAAKKAFDEVGILGDTGGNYETNNDLNPGQDLVLVTDLNDDGLYILDGQGTSKGKIFTKGVLSKPSISDDGKEIVFIGKDFKMYNIKINWSVNPATFAEKVIETNPIWRNVIISKDGLKIAALTKEEKNEIQVFYFGGSSTISNTYTLYNPTFTNGQETGDVNYADAMEFDITGEYIMYDAENELNSVSSGSITYWDISFIKVWENKGNTFSLGKVEKLFSSLPENVSVGNPTFSKNSPYIIAFDYINENGDVIVTGANIERGETAIIYENGDNLGYPNFSNNDKNLVFDANNDIGGAELVGNAPLKPSKIEPNGTPFIFIEDRHWAVWFSNGKRNLSSVVTTNPNISNINMVENPVHQTAIANISISQPFKGYMKVTDINGKILTKQDCNWSIGDHQVSINTNNHPTGMYVISLISAEGISSVKYVKVD
jgi:bacillolysin